LAEQPLKTEFAAHFGHPATTQLLPELTTPPTARCVIELKQTFSSAINASPTAGSGDRLSQWTYAVVSAGRLQ
jgi:hypothetical protein